VETFRAPVNQVSPELVLVDPELASEARARLSDRPWEDFLPAPPPPEPAVVLVEEPGAEAEPAAAPAPYRRRSVTVTIRVPIVATLWAVGLLAVLTTLAFGLVPGGGQGPSLASTTQAAGPPASTAPTSTLRTPPTSVHPVSPPSAAPSFRPARTFAWSSDPDATYYSVVFTRNGKRFFTATPERPRVVLPAKLKFGPGSYAWIVRPGFGARSAKRLGKPLVQSRFTVSG
jgi:hypothetical protein